MRKLKFIFSILVFGSIWGLIECTFGDFLYNNGFPAGILMTGIFAIGFMTLSRMFYKQRGMQLGMGLVAGCLRIINPFTGYFICSGIAIMMESLIFELIWMGISFDLKDLENMTSKISMGIITGYSCYVGGYITTQVLTPVFSIAGFHLSDLFLFIPHMLSDGTWVGLLGGIIIPTALLIRHIDISEIRDSIYYPTGAFVTVLCWIIVIVDAVFILT